MMNVLIKQQKESVFGPTSDGRETIIERNLEAAGSRISHYIRRERNGYKENVGSFTFS